MIENNLVKVMKDWLAVWEAGKISLYDLEARLEVLAFQLKDPKIISLVSEMEGSLAHAAETDKMPWDVLLPVVEELRSLL